MVAKDLLTIICRDDVGNAKKLLKIIKATGRAVPHSRPKAALRRGEIGLDSDDADEVIPFNEVY
jgi:hypothetical protein